MYISTIHVLTPYSKQHTLSFLRAAIQMYSIYDAVFNYTQTFYIQIWLYFCNSRIDIKATNTKEPTPIHL